MIFIKTLKTTLWLPFFTSLLASGNDWVPRLIMLMQIWKADRNWGYSPRGLWTNEYASPWFTVCSHTFYNFHVSSLLDSGETSGCFRVPLGSLGVIHRGMVWKPSMSLELRSLWQKHRNDLSMPWPFGIRTSAMPVDVSHGTGGGLVWFSRKFLWHYANVMYDPVQV